MAVTLPDLDTRSFADLVAEARGLIPAYDPDWTDHNPTDPGMTLVELFAWLTELLIYRIDRITDRHRIAFLRLLNGPSWEPPATDPASLDAQVRTAVLALRTPWRAVTAADYVALAPQAAPDQVRRAHCVARRNLDTRSEAARNAPAEGHLSVVIVPDLPGPAPQPADTLRAAVAAFLEPRRLLATRLHVVGPAYVPVQAALAVVRQPDADPQVTEAAVLEALRAKLDVRTGGADGGGWPFGRAVLASEIYRAATGAPGVAAVINVSLSSVTGADDDAMAVAALPYSVNGEGELVGLRLGPHHLPTFRIGQSSVFVATAYQALTVTAAATPMGLTAAPAIRQAIREAIWSLLDPQRGGPGGTDAAVVTQDALRTAVLARLQSGGGAAVLASLSALDLHAPGGAVAGVVHFAAGQLAELRLSVVLLPTSGLAEPV